MEANRLRGVVAEKFGTCTSFAKAIGWSERKTRDIVNGRQVANAKEINEMAYALQITDPSEFMRTFF